MKYAESSRIHTFIATSEIHMKKKLNMSKQEVIDQAVSAIKRIKKYTNNIEFSPEDAGRSEFDFLCSIKEKAIGSEGEKNSHSKPEVWHYANKDDEILEK